MAIHVLSPSLINKIAAGEVIERPASVVKELIENALDAGATRIDVAVEKGGLEMIRVVDNGCGIAAEELTLAVASHATSKLAREDDLFRVGTLGFRGEALASIAEVSRTVLRSRTPEAAGGAELEVAGGKAGRAAPCGCPTGTAVEVHNLFFNTPVRRKFLRSIQTEFGHVAEAFTRLALAAPHVHFTLRHNDKPVFDLAATDGPLERIARFFGRDLADNLIWVQSVENQVKISGYAAHPSQSRSHNRMQYFFLNGRYIRDRSLQHALGEAYRGLLMIGRYPIAFFTLEMPPGLVDVNVHPTKLEVRFQDSGRLYSQLLSTLRSKFLASDLNTPGKKGDSPHLCEAPSGPYRQMGTVPFFPGGEDPSGAHDAARAEQLRRELVDWAKGKVASWDTAKAPGLAAEQGAGFGEPAENERRPLGLYRIDPVRTAGSTTLPDRPVELGTTTSTAGQASGDTLGHQPIIDRGARTTALQVHNRYLVTESDEGVMVIDQHALHERILYEQLRQRLESGTMESQSLLVPEPIDLSAAEAALALENRDLLARLGMKVEPFGGDTVLIAGYPAMLASIQPGELLRELLERLISEGKQPDERDLLDDLMHAIACKAAIKAGDRLAPEEISALLEQRHLVDDAHHCPHGRPAALVFTREELDRQFRRT
jgi:DNA mismatch repair protein MutL